MPKLNRYNVRLPRLTTFCMEQVQSQPRLAVKNLFQLYHVRAKYPTSSIYAWSHVCSDTQVHNTEEGEIVICKEDRLAASAGPSSETEI